MARILLLISDATNRGMLASALEDDDTVLISEGEADLEQDYDLGIVDGRALSAYRDAIVARKVREEPVILPFLLVSSRQDLGLASRMLWQVVDDIVTKPMGRVELKARLAVLLKLRRLSLTLKRRNEDLQMFIHALSHDLRAPARISLGFATALREDYGEALDERGLHYVSRIETNSDRIRDYLDLLLAYARLGRERVVPQPLPLTPVVNSVVNHARDLIAESNAEVELADSFPTVRADPELMGMVLTNLLTNAIKFVEPGRRPRVRISSRSGEGVVWLEVSDNGIGIHEDDIDRIFQPLIRLHGEEAYAGSGLGLAIVQRVVELMDGEVRVDSALGEGCTFRVRLPAMEGIKH